MDMSSTSLYSLTNYARFIRFPFVVSRSDTHTTLDTGLLLERIDQSTRTGIVAYILPALIKLCLDLLCQGLTQLYAPLVEAVDVPHRPFSKGEVLVVCYQRSKRTGCDLLGKNRCGRSVAEERLVGNELLWGSFGFDFIWCLTNHQRFSLSEKV